MDKVRNSFKYIFIFLFLFLTLWFFGFYNNKFDSMWNYSFSYAIARGEVPYVDFNMVSTPMFSFLLAIPLFISHNYLLYIFSYAFLLTVMFYFLFKLVGKRAWLMLLFLLVPFLHTIIPTYNFFCIFLLIIIFYLEEERGNDYLIGLVLGICILTKHTVGIFFLLPSLCYLKSDYKKIIKRGIGVSFILLLFLGYLLCTKSLGAFIDLCLLGLVDFSNNSLGISIYFYFSIILVGVVLYFVKQNRADIKNYYVLASFSFLIPLFDSYHFCLFLICVLLLVLFRIKENKNIAFFVIPLVITFCLGNFVIHDGKDVVRLSELENLKYYWTDSNTKDTIMEMNSIFNKYYTKEEVPIILSTKSSFIYTGNDLDVNYFLVFLKGNYGYNGSRKLIEKINSEKGKIYIINKLEMEEIGAEGDYLYEVSKYVCDNLKLIDKTGDYLVYRKD